MAHSRRVEKFAALIRREMGELLLNGLQDERIQDGLITISKVEVSPDLQYCKIFISVFGEKIKTNFVMSALQESAGLIRGELARRLQMRRAPEILFKVDSGMEKGASVLSLLDKLEQERQSKEDTNSEAID